MQIWEKNKEKKIGKCIAFKGLLIYLFINYSKGFNKEFQGFKDIEKSISKL